MTKKPTVTTLQSGFNSTETLNSNFEALRDSFDNTLSLDGSTPNAMEADLDLNGNNIIGAAGLLINGTDYLVDVEAAKSAALAAQAAAETAETNAETAETNAESSETAAGLSATAAAASASASAGSAVDATNNGAAQVALAATQVGLATTNGAAQVTLAAAQVALAETAKTAAELAETNAETAESNASASATNAATSETNASTSASTASTKASEAATSATNAATSATESETAKTGAETARDATLAALDSFDDRYLGVKSSDPTVDNDGDALVVGAIYFNSNTNLLYVYNGTSWQVTANAASGDLVSTNNLSDLTSVATARTNLGLDTAATSAATDFVAVTGDSMTGNLNIGDNVKAVFGAGSDLQIYHQTSNGNSIIKEQGGGNLSIQTNGDEIGFYDITNAETMARLNTGGSVQLMHSGDPKLATTSTGVNVTGTLTSDGITLGDNDKAIFGAGSDLQIYHDGSNSYIHDAGVGNLYARANVFRVYNAAGTEISANFVQNGAVTLYHDNAPKIATTSTGVDITGTLTVPIVTITNEIELEGDAGSNALIQKNASTGRDELQIYAGGDAYQTGSRGAGIHLYGNSDNEHDGNFAVLTGPDDNGDGRIIASGREDKTHVTIGNGIWSYVDDGDDHALLNLKGANAQPALLIEGAGDAEGDIVTVTGEAMQFGHWDKATTTFTERMRIDSSGNVGIGTDSPTQELEVHSTGDTTVLVKTSGTGDADATLKLDSADSGESVVEFLHDGVLGAKIEWFTDGGPDLNIVTNAGTNGVIDFQPNNSLAMRIDSSGNVGIGKSNPTTALDVAGTVNATSFTGDGSALTGVGLTSWTSGDNSWASGGTYTLSHSLGTTPKAVQVELVCVVANNGYSVGDVHVLNSGERYSNWGVAVINITSTTVKWGVYNSGIVFRNESSTSSNSKSASQWRVRFTLVG